MRLWSRGRPVGIDEPIIGKITEVPISDADRRVDYVLLGSPASLSALAEHWDGYAGVLCTESWNLGISPPARMLLAPPNLEYLSDGDVVLLSPEGTVRVLYRRNSENNTILTTEQCNSYCLMCSQPPKDVDDSHRVNLILRLLELIEPAAREIGISGGEPTLLGDGFFAIIEKARDWLPTTALHVLSNGRLFEKTALAKRLAAIAHPDLMLGIALYSDVDSKHDYVVQAQGAYDQTLAGFYNLAAAGVRLELRVVLHRQTVERLPQLAEFIWRNLPFIEHVALMGLEMFGFTPRNLDVLWIDPVEYQEQLLAAVKTLALAGMNVSIYNHQLCTIPRSLWPFARKSISDWKNVYLDECNDCAVREFCGGFFQSATKRHSEHIRALPFLSPLAERALSELHYPLQTSEAVSAHS